MGLGSALILTLTLTLTLTRVCPQLFSCAMVRR